MSTMRSWETGRNYLIPELVLLLNLVKILPLVPLWLGSGTGR